MFIVTLLCIWGSWLWEQNKDESNKGSGLKGLAMCGERDQRFKQIFIQEGTWNSRLKFRDGLYIVCADKIS